MTQVYNQPVTRVFTSAGEVAVGYQKFFYDTGTTTKKSIFSDSALTSALSNPLISDSEGYFVQVFMEGTGDDYKVVLATDTDTDPPTSPIWTADPVEVDANDINAFDTRPAQHWGTTTGTSSAYEISPATPITSYSDDLLFSVQIHTDASASATLAAEDGNDLGNFLAALSIKKYDGAGGKVDNEADDLLGNQTYIFRIDSTDVVVLNPEKPFLESTNLSEATETAVGVGGILTQNELDTGTDDTAKFPSALKIKDSVYNNKELIETQTASSSSTISFTDLTSSFTRYILEITDLKAATDSVNALMRVSSDNGSSYDSGASDYKWNNMNPNGSQEDTADSSIQFNSSATSSRRLGSASGEFFNATIEIFNPSNSSTSQIISGRCTFISADNTATTSVGTGFRTTAKTIDAIQFFLSSGNITSGTFKLYGTQS